MPKTKKTEKSIFPSVLYAYDADYDDGKPVLCVVTKEEADETLETGNKVALYELKQVLGTVKRHAKIAE